MTRSSPTRTTSRKLTASRTRPTAPRSPLEERASVLPHPSAHICSQSHTFIDTGANASAEEAEEGAEDAAETKIDVVYSFRLNETGFDKKGYLTYLKGSTNRKPPKNLRADYPQAT